MSNCDIAIYSYISTDAPRITHDMLRWTVFDTTPNVSIVIEFKTPEDNVITELNYNLSVFSSSGLELLVLERTLNTTLSCDTQYWVMRTVSNDCGSANVTITIPPQGKYDLNVVLCSFSHMYYIV